MLYVRSQYKTTQPSSTENRRCLIGTSGVTKCTTADDETEILLRNRYQVGIVCILTVYYVKICLHP